MNSPPSQKPLKKKRKTDELSPMYIKDVGLVGPTTLLIVKQEHLHIQPMFCNKRTPFYQVHIQDKTVPYTHTEPCPGGELHAYKTAACG